MVACFLAFPAEGAIWYVKKSATGANTGADWTNAFPTVQQGVAAAGAGDQVWVSTGTYLPGSLQTESFQLKSGVAIFGGFPGLPGQEGHWSTRNPVTHVTILSGDIAGSDSYHVVLASGTDSTARLDGFLITKGNAKGTTVPTDRGGGLYLSGGSPTIVNCVFRSITATRGGGVCTEAGSAPTFLNCIFDYCAATQEGGAFYNVDSAPVLINCTITACISGYSAGGGMYNSGSNPVLTNSIVYGNTPALQIAGTSSNPLITYSCIQGGFAGQGNISSGPGFVDGDGPNNVYGDADDDLHLASYSACVDAGKNSAVPAGVTLDIEARPRFMSEAAADCPQAPGTCGTPPIVDMGPFEYNSPPAAPTGLTAVVASSTEVSLDWADNSESDLASYNIYRSRSPGFVASSLNRIASGLASSAYVDGTAPDGITNCYVVQAVDAIAQESGPSIQVSAILPNVPEIIYVKSSAALGGGGTSWSDAFRDLGAALASAGPDDQVWVGWGTYKPSPDRLASFQLQSRVAVYGSFPGQPGQEGDFSARYLPPTGTVLSGAIGGSTNTDNSVHVVTARNTDATAILDGFTITYGYAGGGAGDGSDSGGGIYIRDAGPTIRNCDVSGNTAISSGAGVYCIGGGTFTNCRIAQNLIDGQYAGSGAGMFAGGGTVLTDCRIEYNSITRCGLGYGAGLCIGSAILTRCAIWYNAVIANDGWAQGGGVWSGGGDPVLIDCVLGLNRATGVTHGFGEGGGMSSGDSPLLVGCRFSFNEASAEYGYSQGGGFHGDVSSPLGNPTLINCVFEGNSVTSTKGSTGGGVKLNSNGTLVNCTFSSNFLSGTAPTKEGSGLSISSGAISSVAVRNCILWGDNGGRQELKDDSGVAAVSFSCIAGGYPGTGNIASDPRLTTAEALQPDSPCIDAGDNAAVPSEVTTDLSGMPRFFDVRCVPDTGSGGPPTVDMGAFEYPTQLPSAVAADFDGDCDVDGDDFAHFNLCVSGPAVPQTDPLCADADLDGDTVVDQSDFGIFQRCYSGENNPVDPTCAGSP